MFVITGGGSGIGRALAHELATRDNQVLVVGRRQEALAETAVFSPLITVCCADVSTAHGRKIIMDALKPHQILQGLIHNAGVIEPITPIAEIAESDWEQAMATNLNAPLFLTQSLLSKLNTQGRVLHIGSGAAHFPVSAWAPYCVSKAGLSMLTRCWQLEFGHEHAAFTSVMPGIIDTEMQAVIRSAQSMHPKKLEFFHRLFDQKKLLSADTVAQFLAWLLLTIPAAKYASKEWDIYDKSHHKAWLKAPYHVPYLETV
ncbi:MAG: sepiapterin reductase [Legionellales bacterium RIFCSPHIGHO2_12_FULL_42_9]|nr:MAG: sepiapterin reductase [Legionellales bacterium RIFCSPHIGHO2_12_FULL_42_9]